MVFTVRCFKCGEPAVRLVLGGRAILHARCHACGSNLLAEVFEFEQEVRRGTDLRRTMQPTPVEDLGDPPTGDFSELGDLADMA